MINTPNSTSSSGLSAADTPHPWDTETDPTADDIPHAKRPKATNNISFKKVCGCGNMYVTITFLKDDPIYAPYEVMVKLGKAGGCANCQLEAITRTVTAGLRRGVPARVYAKQLKGIQCPSKVWDEGKIVLSCADAIGQVLEDYMIHMDNDTIDEYIKGNI